VAAAVTRLALALLLLLAACAPSRSDPCPWPGFRCAMGGPPHTLADNPPVVVPNPFFCPGPAPSPAPPAPRGEGSLP
jgi:hypothetical protein